MLVRRSRLISTIIIQRDDVESKEVGLGGFVTVIFQIIRIIFKIKILI
ncbi:hypothetical protein KJ656_17575 [bacterium]|nr:hypothetical protein [bacterium]